MKQRDAVGVQAKGTRSGNKAWNLKTQAKYDRKTFTEANKTLFDMHKSGMAFNNRARAHTHTNTI